MLSSPIPTTQENVKFYRRLWNLLKEPRVVTLMHCLSYIFLIAMGTVTLLSPPTTLALAWGQQITFLWALILVIGGSFALCGCLTGLWWLESIGIWSLCLGVGLYIFIVVSLHFLSSGNRLSQAFALIALFTLLISRFARIRGFNLDPTRKMSVNRKSLVLPHDGA